MGSGEVRGAKVKPPTLWPSSHHPGQGALPRELLRELKGHGFWLPFLCPQSLMEALALTGVWWLRESSYRQVFADLS